MISRLDLDWILDIRDNSFFPENKVVNNRSEIQISEEINNSKYYCLKNNEPEVDYFEK